MACGRRRPRPREDGGVDPDMATGPPLESPHFFKIILSDTLESGKLRIPKEFLGRYGKDLSSTVLLKVPGSSSWTIGIEKRNNGTGWLWKGWREFMQHYNIGDGHLIVFKYKGNSTFCVIIFDKSASEIDYLSSSILNLGNGFISPKTEDVIVVEDSEDFAPRQKMRVEPHSPCSQPSPSCSSHDLEDGVGQSRSRASHSKLVFGGSLSPWPLSSFELASEFDSGYPFFKVVMWPSYIMNKVVFRDPNPPRPLATPELAGQLDSEYPFFKRVIRQCHLRKLSVPDRFIRQHIQENKGMATLRYSDRSWPVKLLRYKNGKQASFSAGWTAFARDTHLCVGNACAFELIDREDNVFKVSIFR